MTESHHAVISRLAAEFDALSRQMARVSGGLGQLDRLIFDSVTAPQPAPPPPQPVAPYWQHWQVAAPAPPRQFAPPPPQRTPTPGPPPTPPTPDRESGWIGKLLAVAGVAVTLIGVVLLLVLAAQAGLLRPEIRVTGGILLAVGLVGVATRLRDRPGGRIGAIALAATGIAAAYLDVIALTTIYKWVPAPAGLLLAAAVGGAGLALARRWNSEHLGLLVLVPLTGLAPVITHGVDLLLVGFMLALSAAALPVQLGKDWIWVHAARVAATTLPLLVALVSVGSDDAWVIGAASGIAAILAIAGGLVVLPAISNTAALAVLTAAGTLPTLAAGMAVDRALAAGLAAVLAAAMLVIVLVGTELPKIARQVWSAWSAVSALVAVTVAFDGYLEGPVLLSLAVIVAIAGRGDAVARWAAAGFGVVGTGLFYSYAPLDALLTPIAMPTSIAVSTLAASLLVIATVFAMARACAGVEDRDTRLILGTAAGMLVVYAVTAFTVTAGVFFAGTGVGFVAGHMIATVCWIAMAAALFGYALRLAGREHRAAPITAGLTLTGAATAKLFVFDLATLDGIFRVAAFIVVGLVLLGMGTGYARSLAR